jgi:hypothetical protein
MAIHLILLSELDVVEEVLQFFGSMGSHHKCVIHIMETTHGLEGHPSKCHFLKVFLKKLAMTGDSSEPMANSICSQNCPMKQKEEDVKSW